MVLNGPILEDSDKIGEKTLKIIIYIYIYIYVFFDIDPNDIHDCSPKMGNNPSKIRPPKMCKLFRAHLLHLFLVNGLRKDK